jgi:putative ABC transport system substrate-binding protein
MRRREFVAGLESAAAWPVVVQAQQGERMRRSGVLMVGDENDPLAKARISAFTQALADLGWTEGRNARMDLRWTGTEINGTRALAQELVLTSRYPNRDRSRPRGSRQREWPER